MTVSDVLANQTKTKADKKIIRQEKLPDWANKPPEEKELSKKEKEMIDQEIQDFLKKGEKR